MSDLNGYLINSYAYTLGHAAADFVDKFANRSVGGVELMVYPGHLWPDDMDAHARRDLRERARDQGTPIVTLNMPNADLNVAAPAPGMRAYTIERVGAMVRLAGDLAARGVVIAPGKPNPLLHAPRQQMIDWFHAALDVLLPVARDSGTELWLENVPFSFLPDAASMMAALAAYGSDEVGVVYDIANAFFIDEDLGAGLRAVGERLRLVHVSDTPRARYLHAPVGAGEIDFAAAAAAYAEDARAVPVVLEIISRDPDRDIPASAQRLAAAGWQTA